jgi:predicted GNAT family acetyltransferase
VDTTVVDHPERHRFELRIGDTVAGFAEYRLEPGRVVFTHTEVDSAFEGQGLGSKLASGALDSVRGSGLAIVPLCPFIAAYVRRHPEYQDLVATS